MIGDRCDADALRERGSVAGCQFFITASTWATGSRWVPEGCYAIVVSNPSATAARLRLRFKPRSSAEAREEDASTYTRRPRVNGQSVAYEPLEEGLLGPNDIAIVSAFFKTQPPSWPVPLTSFCPTKAFVEDDSSVAAVDDLVTSSIELLSDVPILASQISHYVDVVDTQPAPVTPYPLFPTHLWETRVVETGIYKPGLPAQLPGVGSPVVPWPGRTFAFAAFDDTHITLPELTALPSSSTRDITITLQHGEVLSRLTNDAFAGRAVVSDKPISLISFTPTTIIDWETTQPLDGLRIHRCYSAAMPSSLWGSEYVAARHGNRWEELAEAPAWRIIGGVDDTLLSYRPYRPDGAPDRVAKGELRTFFADEAFRVASQDAQHPFYFSESMTSPDYQQDRYGVAITPESHRGASFTVHQIATSHWQKHYPFFAPLELPDYSLVVVRPHGGPDVRLDCAGTIDGWQPVDEGFDYARVRLTHHSEGVEYPLGKCFAGAHWIESDGPFSGTLWGWGTAQESTDGAFAVPLLGAEEPIVSSAATK